MIKLVLPKGRQQATVESLLAEAGFAIRAGRHEYRPLCVDERFEVKMLKAANIPKLIEYGAHDIGFAGFDWVTETAADVEELLDTGLSPVRLVSAGPVDTDPFSSADGRPLIVASEYERITTRYMESKNCEFRFVRSFGATEVFPPEDADLIVDNTATGAALRTNGLEVIDQLLCSSTRLVANRQTLADVNLRTAIDEFVLLINSVLEGRQRVLLDMNVPTARLDAVVEQMPAMKSPTIQRLHGEAGFAVRAAVHRREVARIIPAIRAAGATDILETSINKAIA